MCDTRYARDIREIDLEDAGKLIIKRMSKKCGVIWTRTHCRDLPRNRFKTLRKTCPHSQVERVYACAVAKDYGPKFREVDYGGDEGADYFLDSE